MSLEEEVLWGMAAGPELDVGIPAIGLNSVFSYTGAWLTDPQCSYDGRYMGFSYKNIEREEFGYLLFDAETGVFSVDVLPPDTYNASIRPVGEGWVYEFGDGICTANLDGSDPTCFSGNYGQPIWSPNGEWLLVRTYGYTNGLAKVRPDGSEATSLVSVDEGYISRAVWAPDSSQVTYVHPRGGYENPGDLWIVGADGLDPTQLLTATVVPYSSLAWDPNQSLIAVSGFDGGVWLVPPDGSDPWIVPGTEGASWYDATWSPTASGWPLMFLRSGEYSWYYASAGDAEAMRYATAKWMGWCPGETPTAVFGQFGGTDAEPWAGVYYFDIEPDFWP
jgi:hypothetical protein